MTNRPSPLSLFTITAIAALGCASVATTPGGPLQRAGTIQLSEAAMVGLSRIDTTTTSSDSGSTISERGWYADGLTARVGGRVAIADSVDAEADWGFAGIGGEIRAGLAEGTTSVPFAVSLGARSAALAPFVLDDKIREQHEVRIRLELYPLLARRLSRGGARTRLHGVVALGASRGRHLHDHRLVTGDSLSLLRNEDRLEAALGAELRVRRLVASLIAMPFYVAGASAPTIVSCGIGHCYEVDQRSLGSYAQSFGVTVVLTVGLALNQ